MNPLIPLAVVLFLLSGLVCPTEAPQLSVIENGGIYYVDIDQHRAGPGTLHAEVLDWNGNTVEVNVNAASPFRFDFEQVLFAEYIAENGQIYTWEGGVGSV